jgi:hypothetical protein
MAENNLGLEVIAGHTLYAGRNTTYMEHRCTLMQSSAAADVNIDGVLVPLGVGVQTAINIRPTQLGADPTVEVAFWCSCLDGCNPNAFTGTTAPSSYYSGMTGMKSITIIGGGGLNN